MSLRVLLSIRLPSRIPGFQNGIVSKRRLVVFMHTFRKISICCPICLFCNMTFQATNAQENPARSLDESSWQIAPQAEVKESGEQLSKPDFEPSGWLPAQVPGTVFNSYVLAGKEKDPNFGDNIYKVDLKKYDRNFWYRTNFTVPADFSGGRIWLNLDAVNRDADIYVNGSNLGSMHGFLQRGRFDVTGLVHAGATNSLALLAYVPLLPNVKSENFSSPSFICTKGWDWMPRVPGFDMGIYKDVYLSHTNDVSLIDPWVRTEQANLGSADLSLQTDLQNTSTSGITGELVGEINPGNITFTQSVTLAPSETKTVHLNATEAPALHISNPKLWWPNGYGDPNLYKIHLSFRVGSTVSDQKDITFGIRKYTYDTDNKTLHFHINGIPIYPKGGSWGMAEYLLRCRAKDYDTMVRFHREENFNIIRNWMGMTPDEAFYDACDKNGIMVWDEFWLNSSGGLPADQAIFGANVVEKIKQFRNHACVALWCAENEATPPAPINDLLREAVKTYDGDDRYYQENSHEVNLSGSGPWHDLDLKQYFKGVPILAGGKLPYGMRSEIGTATFTNFDSFKKFMPQDAWWPRGDMWNKHFFGPSARNAGPDGYFSDLKRRYGPAHGIEEFCLKSQLLSFETMKAMFEGWLDHSDKDSAGIIIWMSQSAYPSFVWQTYDYYYDLTGAFWGAKSACEPIHIYWNENDDRIRVVNTTGKSLEGLTADAQIYNLDGTQKFDKKSDPFTSTPDHVADCFTLTYPADLSPTHFVRLRLTDGAGKLISENFYWRGVDYLNFRGLAALKHVNLQTTSQSSLVDGEQVITASVTNPTDSQSVAFAIRPMLLKPGSGDQILPVHVSDGFFSLLPGETRQVTFRFDPVLSQGEEPKVEFRSYNNSFQELPPIINGSGNLSLDKDVKASTSDVRANGADAVVDGNPATQWMSAKSDPQWVMIDLEKSTPITRVKLVWASANATSYAIQVSDDGTNWVDIYTTTSGKGGVDDLMGLKGQGRYIRMLGTKRANPGYGYSLVEFEVYGH